jgi:hypothetical protein
VVADRDLDHAVLDAGVDVDDDRAWPAGMDDGVRERLARREEDVADLLVVGLLRGEPDPELGTEKRRLAFAGRQAKAEPVFRVSSCRGYVDGNPPGSRYRSGGPVVIGSKPPRLDARIPRSSDSPPTRCNSPVRVIRRTTRPVRVAVGCGARSPADRRRFRWGALHDRHGRDAQALVAAQTTRLVRDLLALDVLSPRRPTAAERLDTILGPELVAAVRSGLGVSPGGTRRHRSQRIA